MQNSSVAYIPAIKFAIFTAVFFYYGSIQRNTRERAMSPRPREDLSMERGIGCGIGCPADRAGSGRCIRANRKLIARQVLHSMAGHHQHDDVGGLGSDLEAEAAAAERDCSRSSPSGVMTANGVSLAVISAHDKRGLLQTWNDDDALRFLQQIARDALIRGSHHFTKNVGR